MALRENLIRSTLVVLLSTAVLGLAYPVVVTLLAQVAFSDQASGSLLQRGGRTVGSKLAAQAFTSARYFHERPSATAPPYNAAATTFSNLGPNSSELLRTVRGRIAAVLELERPYNPRLRARDIPVDAVTASGSGIDPDISKAYAELQAPRIARVRRLPLATVRGLIDGHTHGRWLGVLGEPGVNVLELNLALDGIAR
jgi:potassium-transporting ATPase KdpC subunit